MIPPAPADDRRVLRAFGTSALLRAADRVITVVWQAAEESRAAILSSRQTQYWRGLAPRGRSTLVGVTLAIAAAVHLGLVVTQDRPAGWLWLVPPGITATIGVMLLVWPRPGEGVN